MSNSYRNEDVQQILQRALARQQEGEFSRQQLEEMATELGIAPEALQAAEQEWLRQRGEESDRRKFDAYRRRAFKAHLIPYLAVNTFLILLNLVTTPGNFWAIYPLLGWGLGLFFQGWRTFQTEGETYEQDFQQWRQRLLTQK
jgi:hypothetical protein